MTQHIVTITCGLLFCLSSTVVFSQEADTQAPAEENKSAPAKNTEPQPQPETTPGKPAETKEAVQPAPQPKKQAEPQKEKTPQPAATPEEAKDKQPPKQPQWKAELEQKHELFLTWLEKNYPKKAELIKKEGDEHPDKFIEKLTEAMKTYGPILKAEKNNPELAEVLRKDLELQSQRDELLTKLRTAKEDQRQPLLDELNKVVAARFDVIIQKKQIEYDRIRKRLDWLNKKLERHGEELQKLKDEKDQSVKKRTEELIKGEVKMDWK